MLYVFDFDGTIVDVWRRYWTVFRNAAGIDVDFSSYHKLKLGLRKDESIAAFLGSDLPKDYFANKAKLLEENEQLVLDSPIVSPDRLIEFFCHYSSIILTKRRDELAFRKQLIRLGLGELVPVATVLSPGGLSKSEWIASRYIDDDLVMIGDSPEDMEVGKLKRAETAFVQTGLFTYSEASKYHASNMKFDSINEVLIAIERCEQR